jgi:hypothetical protein
MTEDPGRRDEESSEHAGQEDSLLKSPRRPAAPQGRAEPVPEEQLAEVEADLCPEDFVSQRELAMANNLMQRRRDNQLLQMLAAADFIGTRWEYFANELAAYGIPVLMSWIRTREIAKLCADRGRPIRPLPTDWLVGERLDLTTLTIARAINVFRDKVLRPGLWDPACGATIKSFFMGSVIQQFPNYYNSWYDERLRNLEQPARWSFEDSPDLSLTEPSKSFRDPAGMAINRHYLSQVLGDMPEDLRTACLLLYQGYSIKDAAAAIGKTGDALSEQLRRYRRGRGGRMR